jgi:hypothetical protein
LGLTHNVTKKNIISLISSAVGKSPDYMRDTILAKDVPE